MRALSPTRRWILFGIAAWLPLGAIAAIERILGEPIEPSLRDGAVHVRILVAVPLFLIAEALLADRTSEVAGRLAAERLVGDTDGLAELERRRARRARIWPAQIVFGALAILFGQLQLWSGLLASGPLARGVIGGQPLAPGSLYCGFVALPIFLFVGTRVLFRWLAWALFLFGLLRRRRRLRPEPAHPDRAGGLALLSRPTTAMALFVLANTAVFAAAWSGRVARGQVSDAALTELFVVWLAAWLLLTFGPLFAFTGTLLRARRAGLRDYDRLALIYTRRFRRRWITPDPGPELLGTGDIQALNDLGGSYQLVDSMRPLPFGPRELLAVIVCAVLPMIALLATRIPLSKLLLKALRVLVG